MKGYALITAVCYLDWNKPMMEDRLWLVNRLGTWIRD